MNKYIVQISTWLAVLLTVGCNPKHTSNYSKKSNKKVNAYTKKHDSHPLHNDIPDLTLVREPEPKHEPKSRYGNPAKYTVLNKTYSVLTSSKGYKERGYASWYGTKFHGFRTSSGEIYDMYSMTAAHKTLPLPTYAKVTNLNNNRSIIVKINDRGPFHDDRIVDLSYAAASKLGILANGVGKVEVVAINPSMDLPKRSNIMVAHKSSEVISTSEATPTKVSSSLQLGAFTLQSNAKKLADQLESLLKNHPNNHKTNYQVNIIEHRLQKNIKENILYKVVISSVNGEFNILNLKKILSDIPSHDAFVIN